METCPRVLGCHQAPDLTASDNRHLIVSEKPRELTALFPGSLALHSCVCHATGKATGPQTAKAVGGPRQQQPGSVTA